MFKLCKMRTRHNDSLIKNINSQNKVLYKEHCKKPTANTPLSNAPYKHSDQTGHAIDYEALEIIDRAYFNF